MYVLSRIEYATEEDVRPWQTRVYKSFSIKTEPKALRGEGAQRTGRLTAFPPAQKNYINVARAGNDRFQWQATTCA